MLKNSIQFKKKKNISSVNSSLKINKILKSNSKGTCFNWILGFIEFCSFALHSLHFVIRSSVEQRHPNGIHKVEWMSEFIVCLHFRRILNSTNCKRCDTEVQTVDRRREKKTSVHTQTHNKRGKKCRQPGKKASICTLCKVEQQQ